MGITDWRRRAFCRAVLERAQATVTLVDAGSGGTLKAPWSVLPADRLVMVGVEPADAASAALCVSNTTGPATFRIARDPRGSSLHPPSLAFVERFGQPGLLTDAEVTVERTTVDALCADRLAEIDALDVNVEGHDLQVLQGATRLLSAGGVALVKVEFELALVWEGQGWFADIDQLLRAAGYDLVDLQVDRIRPVNVARLYAPGEPVWGKACYAPSPHLWRERWAESRSVARLARAVALLVAANVPGRACDLIGQARSFGVVVPGDDLHAGVAGVYGWARVDAVVTGAAATLRRLTGRWSGQVS